MNYYIADLHLGHENIIRFSKRPFENADQMNKTIIENWNSVVTDNDDVYILGDFSYRINNPREYLGQLKGRKHLIIGNHDGALLRDKKAMSMFESVDKMLTVTDGNSRIVLCHYPLVEWDGYYRNTIHFYGHVHNTFHNETTAYASKMKNAYNVGVDIIDFTPRTKEEIIKQSWLLK